jgi:hypothetical protein
MKPVRNGAGGRRGQWGLPTLEGSIGTSLILSSHLARCDQLPPHTDSMMY